MYIKNRTHNGPSSDIGQFEVYSSEVFFLLQTIIGPLAAWLTKLSNLPQLSKLNSSDSMACYGIFMKGYGYVVWVNVKFS